MKTRKNTKRALVISALSLLLCVSMLVGTTFAWFTDNASTSVNTIQAGTLDIVLEMKEGNEWVDAKGKTLEFLKAADAPKDEEILWEPGATYDLPQLRIRNNGNLALTFDVVISGIGGDAKLNEAIEWSYSYTNKNDTAIQRNENGYPLLPGEYAHLTISGHMKKEAGNEYQGMSINGISVTVTAAQHTHEYDSTGNQYDAAASFAPSITETVTNQTELDTAVESAKVGDVIGLESGTYKFDNVKTDATFAVQPNENVTIELGDSGSIVTNASANDDENKINEPTVYNQGNLTIEGGTISNKNATNGNTNVAAIHNVAGTLTLKGSTIENVSPASGGNYAVVVEGGKVILDDCTVKGGRGGIAVSGSGSVEMTGGSVSATRYYPLYMRGAGKSVFKNVTFTKLASSSGKAIAYNEFAGGSAAFTNCTFKSNLTSETKLEINNKVTGFTFDNCTFDNVANPNA